MIILYTGNGKGKTTAALGLALRNVGHGRKVAFIQFMKQSKSGESKVSLTGFELKQFGRDKLLTRDTVEQVDKELANEALDYARSVKCDLLVLDEVNVALYFGLITLEDVLKLIDEKEREGVLVVLTGRYAPDELVERADIVTEMKEVKHAFNEGVPAQEGVEW
ncbi:MAG: cob(I)yrinic acid a,c-diamide adenosyltransferase [Candidatus Diapherotrites archaeon]|nr:cob(I)yrinic acid a,c-diamide adenosyltransferase [Candidatus Diapherotrites archaeon]